MSLHEKARALSQAKARDLEFTWQRELARYRANVRMLYTNVESWLAPYVPQDLKIVHHEVTRHEEDLGNYLLEELVLNFSEQKIRLMPGGVCVAGTKGVVDVLTGEKRPPVATLVLLDEGGRLQWVVRYPDERHIDRQFHRGELEKLLDEHLRT